MSKINELHKKISENLYVQLLKDYEDDINKIVNKYEDYKIVSGLLDNIIKIKTIQALNVSAELITESRKVLKP